LCIRSRTFQPSLLFVQSQPLLDAMHQTQLVRSTFRKLLLAGGPLFVGCFMLLFHPFDAIVQVSAGVR